MSCKQFRLDSHQKIHQILQSLDAGFLTESCTYFGGGTLLTLLYNEYRWSKDIDFLCSSKDGYRLLRTNLREKGHGAIFKDQQNIRFPRDIKIDRDKITFAVELDDLIVKFEIILEARIQLGSPTFHDWVNVPCLSFEDSCTEKLLANSDRWIDKAIESRDLIDLAILRNQAPIPFSSYEHAESAYPVTSELKSAIRYFQENNEYRQRCLNALQIANFPTLIDGIDLLAADHDLPATVREDNETLLENWV